MAKEKDPEDYADALLAALNDEIERFDFGVAEIDGFKFAYIACDGKPVAMVLPNGFDTLDDLLAEPEGDDEDEGSDDEQADDEDDSRSRRVSGSKPRTRPRKEGKRRSFKP